MLSCESSVISGASSGAALVILSQFFDKSRQVPGYYQPNCGKLAVDMEQELEVLIARLPGLEAARKAIEDQIAEIHRQISLARVGQQGVQSKAPADPGDVLGHDSLGRIKRRRNLSPEVREAKRKLIAAARQKKLDRLHQIATAQEEKTALPGEEPK